MVVKSRTISVTIEEMAYSLSISVAPTSGKVGDLFTFGGGLLLDGGAVEGVTVNLVLEETGEAVGTDTTNVDGNWTVFWTADRGGTLHFHAEAPYLSVASRTVTIALPVPGVWGVALILAPILVGGALIAASRW